MAQQGIQQVARSQELFINSAGDISISGQLTAGGDIVMQKTASQGYLYAYDTTGTKYIRVYHNGNATMEANSGTIDIIPSADSPYINISGHLVVAPAQSGNYDLGASGSIWRNLFLKWRCYLGILDQNKHLHDRG